MMHSVGSCNWWLAGMWILGGALMPNPFWSGIAIGIGASMVIDCIS